MYGKDLREPHHVRAGPYGRGDAARPLPHSQFTYSPPPLTEDKTKSTTSSIWKDIPAGFLNVGATIKRVFESLTGSCTRDKQSKGVIPVDASPHHRRTPGYLVSPASPHGVGRSINGSALEPVQTRSWGAPASAPNSDPKPRSAGSLTSLTSALQKAGELHSLSARAQNQIMDVILAENGYRRTPNHYADNVFGSNRAPSVTGSTASNQLIANTNRLSINSPMPDGVGGTVIGRRRIARTGSVASVASAVYNTGAPRYLASPATRSLAGGYSAYNRREMSARSFRRNASRAGSVRPRGVEKPFTPVETKKDYAWTKRKRQFIMTRNENDPTRESLAIHYSDESIIQALKRARKNPPGDMGGPVRAFSALSYTQRDLERESSTKKRSRLRTTDRLRGKTDIEVDSYNRVGKRKPTGALAKLYGSPAKRARSEEPNPRAPSTSSTAEDAAKPANTASHGGKPPLAANKTVVQSSAPQIDFSERVDKNGSGKIGFSFGGSSSVQKSGIEKSGAQEKPERSMDTESTAPAGGPVSFFGSKESKEPEVSKPSESKPKIAKVFDPKPAADSKSPETKPKLVNIFDPKPAADSKPPDFSLKATKSKPSDSTKTEPAEKSAEEKAAAKEAKPKEENVSYACRLARMKRIKIKEEYVKRIEDLYARQVSDKKERETKVEMAVKIYTRYWEAKRGHEGYEKICKKYKEKPLGKYDGEEKAMYVAEDEPDSKSNQAAPKAPQFSFNKVTDIPNQPKLGDGGFKFQLSTNTTGDSKKPTDAKTTLFSFGGDAGNTSKGPPLLKPPSASAPNPFASSGAGSTGSVIPATSTPNPFQAAAPAALPKPPAKANPFAISSAPATNGTPASAPVNGATPTAAPLSMTFGAAPGAASTNPFAAKKDGVSNPFASSSSSSGTGFTFTTDAKKIAPLAPSSKPKNPFAAMNTSPGNNNMVAMSFGGAASNNGFGSAASTGTTGSAFGQNSGGSTASSGFGSGSFQFGKPAAGNSNPFANTGNAFAAGGSSSTNAFKTTNNPFSNPNPSAGASGGNTNPFANSGGGAFGGGGGSTGGPKFELGLVPVAPRRRKKSRKQRGR